MLCDYGCGQEAKYKLKNGKNVCSNSHNKCPAIRLKNSNKQKLTYKFPEAKDNPANFKVECNFCQKLFSRSNIKKHINSCYLNPINLKICPICSNPIKDYKNNETCSSKCAKIHFSEQYRKYAKIPWANSNKDSEYREICFKYHEKKCIICGEDLIVSVHHYDENHANDLPENLVPMCPTHHQYMHSSYKYILKECVDEYVYNFCLGVAQSGYRVPALEAGSRGFKSPCPDH